MFTAVLVISALGVLATVVKLGVKWFNKVEADFLDAEAREFREPCLLDFDSGDSTPKRADPQMENQVSMIVVAKEERIITP